MRVLIYRKNKIIAIDFEFSCFSKTNDRENRFPRIDFVSWL